MEGILRLLCTSILNLRRAMKSVKKFIIYIYKGMFCKRERRRQQKIQEKTEKKSIMFSVSCILIRSKGKLRASIVGVYHTLVKITFFIKFKIAANGLQTEAKT